MCDWIEFKSCHFGYGILFDKIFKKTPYDLDYYNEYVGEDGEYYNASKDKRNAIHAVRMAWELYLREFHPDLIGKENMPGFRAVCPLFLGANESKGLIYETSLLWGYEIKPDLDLENWEIFFDFPIGSKDIFIDFISRFELEYCKKKEMPQVHAEINDKKNEITKITKFGIFGHLYKY